MQPAQRPAPVTPARFFVDVVQELMQLPPDALFDAMVERLSAHYGARHACVHLVDPSILPGGLHRCPPGQAAPEQLEPLMQSEASWMQLAARTGSPVRLHEALAQASLSVLVCDYFRFTDGVSVPLVSQGEHLGALNLYLQEGALGAEDVAAMASLGGVVYGLVKRSEMQRKVEGRDEVIAALAHAVEAKDPLTGQHLARVRGYAVRLARTLGLPDDEVAAVDRAALLHDVGKIGVPDAVLTKPGALDAAEWEAIRRHPRLGGEILRHTRDPELVRALPGILSHHERPDGQGYPDGLVGDSIPLIARIIAVADVFDVLTSDRPYRKGIAPAAALAILTAEAGKQLDADLVARFIASGCYQLPAGA